MSLLSKFRLPIGVITVFVVGTDLFAVSTLLPSIADDLQTGVGSVAWTVPVFSAAYLVTSPAMGRLAENRGHRPVLLVGMLAFAVANLLIGLASSLWALVAFCVLAGAAAAAMLLLIVPQRISWPIRLHRGIGNDHPTGVPIAQRLRAISVTAVWGAAVYGFYTYLGVQLHADFGPAVVAGGLLIYGLAAVAGNIIGGRLSDRLGTRYLVPASQIGLACSLLVLAIGWPTPAVTIVGLAGAALTGYPAFPAHQARLSAAHPMQSANLLAGFRGVLLLSVGLALIAAAASRRPVADGIDRRGTSSIGCQRTIQEHRA